MRRRSSTAASFPIALFAIAALFACGRTPLEDGSEALDGGAAGRADAAVAGSGTAGAGSGGSSVGGSPAAGREAGAAGGGRAGVGGSAGRGGAGGRAGAGGSAGTGGIAGDAGARLEIAPVSVTAMIGQEVTYRATIWRGIVATDVTAQAAWTLSEPKIATMNGNVLIARAAGMSAITAEAMGLAAKGAVTVFPNNAFVKLRIEPAAARINVKEQRAFRAIAVSSGGAEMDVTTGATWSTDGMAFQVSNEPATRGLVTGIQPGSGSLTALYGPLTAETSVTVAEPDETWMLVIEPPTGSARLGGVVRFSLVGRRAADGMMRSFTSIADWKPENAQVADFVAGPGVATCRRDGVTSFSASAAGVGAATGQISCSSSPAAVLRLTPAETTVPAGSKLHMAATIYFEDGSSTNVTARATWRSSDANVATVTRSGQNATMTAVGDGTATITAAADGLEGTAAITVTPR